VTLTPAAAGATSVDAATADGTATAADGDYVTKTQTLNFPAGVTSQPFTVTGDSKFEPTEAFSVALTSPTGGAVVSGTNGSASGTINNDDPSPTISINDISQNEGAAGTTAFTFNVT